MFQKILRPFERKIERNPKLNLLYAAGEMTVWGLLTYGISWSSHDSIPEVKDTIPVFIGIVVAWHFFLFYLIHRHIFNYEYPMMAPHMMGWKETHPIIRLWSSMVGGQLFLLSSFVEQWVMGVVACLIFPTLFVKFLTRELPVEYEAGTKPVLPYRAKEHFENVKHPRDPGIYFGGVALPTQELTTHMKVIGSTRSGKTNVLRLMMQGVLLRKDTRALIYDPKTEFPSILAGMGISEEEMLILNPFDARAYAWDMAKDLTDDRDAEALAQILVPENPNAGAGRFFDDATRILIGAVAKLFMEYAPGRWTLRDLILACESIELISILLQNDPDLQADLKVAGAGETAGNVMATVASVTRRGLKTVAAYLHYHHERGRTFSLQDWMENYYVLLLGCDRRSKATLQPLNQLLLTRASQLLTSQRTDGYTFLILDELPELGKIGDIDRVAKLGASYKVCLSIAFQSYSDLKQIYGDNIANSLIGQCDKSAYLRVLDSETAEWQAKQIGQCKVKRKMKSYGAAYSASGKGAIAGQMTSLSEQQDKEYPFPPEYFLNLEKPDKDTRTGVGGVYKVGHFIYQHEITSQFLSKAMRPESAEVAEFIDIPERPKLPRWNKDDAERLDFVRVLQGVEIERLEGTDLHHLLSHSDLNQGPTLEPIPLPDFLEGDDGFEGNGSDTNDRHDDDDSSLEEDQDYTNNPNYPPYKPGHSPRR